MERLGPLCMALLMATSFAVAIAIVDTAPTALSDTPPEETVRVSSISLLTDEQALVLPIGSDPENLPLARQVTVKIQGQAYEWDISLGLGGL